MDYLKKVVAASKADASAQDGGSHNIDVTIPSAAK